MGLRINSNIEALDAQRNLGNVTKRLGRNFARLSSGLRIASAVDDAAGLAVSERIAAEVRGLNQASRNANDAVSLASTADAGAAEVGDLLKRLKEIVLQSKNGTVSNADKDTLNTEFNDLINEIDRISQTTTFNEIKLLEGTNTSISFQVGTGATSNDTIAVTLTDIDKAALNLTSLTVASTASAGQINTALSNVNSAINSVNTARGKFGSALARVSSTSNTLAAVAQNLEAARSRIRDVDVAFESSDLTRNSIIQQSAIAILSQANIRPQAALELLRG